MLQQPVRQRNPAQQITQSATIPPPYGGWNARDSVASMQVTDAVVMDNLVPSRTSVSLRKGFAEHATGLPDAVETLMKYNAAGTSELWAISDGEIYDVTSVGAVGSAVVSSLSNSRWQYVQFGNAAGTYLLAVNGVDNARRYDGTSWITISGTGTGAITGVGTDTIINIGTFKRRLFLIEENSLSFWYLAADAIAGAAAEFNLAPLFNRGGYLVAMGNWTRDAGDGPDDFCVFLTSEGEVAVFAGDDPGSASAWGLVGIYRVGRPIGRRCLSKVGPDLFLMTENGYYSLTQAVQSAALNQSTAISDKIRNAVQDSFGFYGTNFGWEMISYPRQDWLLVNVPIQENIEAAQYVVNTSTGVWTRFLGMPANAWALFEGDLYFGGDTVVYQADTGNTDAGAEITAEVQQAYTVLGASGNPKQVQMVRPMMRVGGILLTAVDVLVNYQAPPPNETASPWSALGSISDWDQSNWIANTTLSPGAGLIYFENDTGVEWDTAFWDTELWGDVFGLSASWKPVNKLGVSVSVRMFFRGSEADFDWLGTTYAWATSRGLFGG